MKYALYFLLFLVSMTSVLASQPTIPTIYPYQEPTHAYSVLFDGEGEASVIARLTIHNTKTAPIQTLRLEIPGNRARIINIAQQTLEPQQGGCVMYNRENPIECLQYDGYPRYRADYQLLTPADQRTSNAIILDLTLPKPLASQETTTLILAYKSPDYATQRPFGVYSYAFQTIKTAYDITTTQVGINVAEDLYLKEGTSRVAYQDNVALSTLLQGKTAIAMSEATLIQDYTSRIGQGGYVRRASALDPWESVTVQGSYATTWIMLHLRKTALILLFCLFLILAILLGIKKLRRVLHHAKILPPVVTTALRAGIGLALGWSLFFLLVENFHRWFGYGIYNEGLFYLPIAIILAISTILLLIAPPIYYATKYNPLSSVWYLIIFLVTFVLAFIILFLLYTTLRTPSPPSYYPMPL